MAWTANLIKEDPVDQLKPQVTIIYSDSKRKDRQLYDVKADTDLAYFKDVAAKRVAELNAIDAAFATIVDGPLTPQAKVPTQDEIDLQAFLDANAQKLANEKAVAAGALKDTDQKVMDDLAVWKTAFKPGYEKYI